MTSYFHFHFLLMSLRIVNYVTSAAAQHSSSPMLDHG